MILSHTQHQRLGFIIAGLLLAILMASMDNTIVVTAMGTIVGDLGGLDSFVWVVSAFMVAEMAGMPIFGKLSDMYGRKRFFLFGSLLFMAGSALCGTAASIEQLSIYRAIQGIGGGALIPIAFTIIFDIFPPEKRGKISGLFGAVFGLSSIFGPLIGAYITDYISWHWVFYINLPLGFISFILILLFYQEAKQRKKQKIDWFGAITLVGAVVCLMFALELGGETYDWNSNVILLLFGSSACFFICFFLIERKAAEPIISLDMFKNRLFAASTLVALFYGATFISATVQIPIFVQGVYGDSATNSGLILLPMMLGSVISAQIGGFLTTKMSYRNIMLISGLFLVAGFSLLSTMNTDTPRLLLTGYMIVVGLGVGFSFSVLSMAAIHHFGPNQRGSATSTSNFLRSLGMTVGASIFGMLQKNSFSEQMSDLSQGGEVPGAAAQHDANQILSSARASIPPDVLKQITEALSNSIVHTFSWAILSAAIALFLVLLMPKDRMNISAKSK
ncbi:MULTISPECIES: MDR family MFS transporter [Bacillus]|uniref:DHA2 family efflux MFS transporter permease subunit n=2 Tax=Bacillaceae TaxID=186817 RepID=A0AAJ3YY70_9BACI|nr:MULTISPECIES: MDR family MFS transporter [Bacillus]KKB71817.1 major facilitator transporter [Bacillus sp. TH008]MBU8785072.1 MFS transporter [Bacillus glycinifermentans]MDU0073912.1 MDR family MFS transporter [Bacillus sp. IG6]MED8021803.1 MDR family MFS transporter [Bacillus glycinifermentans]QAT65590.1 DHA2 family efflux MFS transporter permease subunit [Bacillus glycinifermentans]